MRLLNVLWSLLRAFWAFEPEQSLLEDQRGQGLIEYVVIGVLSVIVVGAMAYTIINTVVSRGQEVNNWIAGI